MTRLWMLLVAAAVLEGCSCSPPEECAIVRALCKADLCIEVDPGGWYACESHPDRCDGIETSCQPRTECQQAFLARCAERMVPGAVGFVAYAQCARLDCRPGATSPPIGPGPPPGGTVDASRPHDARPPGPPPDGPLPCAGTWCGGACCTAYPCFFEGGCSCVESPEACQVGDGGGFTPTCCSDAPLCSAQGKQCCFVPGGFGMTAQTRCLSKCISPSSHCTFAPFLQADGTSSCLPPPHDSAGAQCPF